MDNKDIFKMEQLEKVVGGDKTLIGIDDTKPITGPLVMEIEGEMVTLVDDGEGGFRGTINGKERWFSYDEIKEMLRIQLGS